MTFRVSFLVLMDVSFFGSADNSYKFGNRLNNFWYAEFESNIIFHLPPIIWAEIKPPKMGVIGKVCNWNIWDQFQYFWGYQIQI